MALVLASDCDYAQLLAPAPISICLLGQLIMVTSKGDVSLKEHGVSKERFQLIRNPESLRASILQVVHTGWDSFNTASKNMEEIRLLSSEVSPLVKDIITVSECLFYHVFSCKGCFC